MYKKDKLSKEQVLQLNKIGFRWDGTQRYKELSSEKFKRRLNQLIDYKKKNGKCNVPRSHSQLGTWVSNIRQGFQKGTLLNEHIIQLQHIGFAFTVKKQRQKPGAIKPEERFNVMVVCKEKSDNCDVSGSLASLDRKGSVSHEHTKRHTGLDFKKDLWKERFNDLVVYKQKTGNCNVPQKQGGIRDMLGTWVKNQRHKYKKGQLAQERVAQLEGIEFEWSSNVEQWRERFNELTEYKERNGNCNVPQRGFKELGRWVSTQRTFYKQGKLSQERTTQLEDIGFVWRS